MRTRERDSRAARTLPRWILVQVAGASVIMGCAATKLPDPGSVEFDSAELWLSSGPDSARVEVDLACSTQEQDVGLRGRRELAEDRGVLFLFESTRGAAEGFWMWDTSIPLDIAYLDEGGVVRRIHAMEPCMQGDPDACPVYEAGVPHRAALEVNRSWLSGNGVSVGWKADLQGLCPLE